MSASGVLGSPPLARSRPSENTSISPRTPGFRNLYGSPHGSAGTVERSRYPPCFQLLGIGSVIGRVIKACNP